MKHVKEIAHKFQSLADSFEMLFTLLEKEHHHAAAELVPLIRQRVSSHLVTVETALKAAAEATQAKADIAATFEEALQPAAKKGRAKAEPAPKQHAVPLEEMEEAEDTNG